MWWECSLRVPAGVDTDSRLRVREEGNSGRRGGPPGDLFVFITVKPDPSAPRPAPPLQRPVLRRMSIAGLADDTCVWLL